MNRQVITFFSLFTLILVLSVYYILIPPASTNQSVSTDNSMQDLLDLKRSEQKSVQNEILASSTSTGEQLNDALNIISETQTNENIELNVKNKLTELGFENVFCEIDHEVIKITISKKNHNIEDVLLVMEHVDELCNQKYTPEIKFINEWLAI